MLHTSDGKCSRLLRVFSLWNFARYAKTLADKEVVIELTEGGDSAEVTIGKAIEVRGEVKDSATVRVSGKDFNMYDSEFDMLSYE